MKKLALLLVLIFAVSFVFADVNNAEEVDVEEEVCPIEALEEEVAALKARIADLEKPARMVPYIQGWFRGTVTLSGHGTTLFEDFGRWDIGDGLRTDLVNWHDWPCRWRPFEFGFRVNVPGTSITVRLGRTFTDLTIPVGDGWAVALNSISVSTEGFSATWWRSTHFSSAAPAPRCPGGLGWFTHIDYCEAPNTAVLDFKEGGFQLGFQNDKAALRIPAIGPLAFSAQLRLRDVDAPLAFDGAGAELRGSNILGGFGFVAAVDTRDQPNHDDLFSYGLDAWYELNIDLGLLSMMAKPYARFSNMYVSNPPNPVDSGKYAGIEAIFDYEYLYAHADYRKYFLNPDTAVYPAGTVAAQDYLRFRAFSVIPIGPVTLQAHVGTGNIHSVPWWCGWLIGNLLVPTAQDRLDLSIRGALAVAIPIEARQFSNPTLSVEARYYVGEDDLRIPITLSTDLYHVVELRGGLSNVLDPESWYVALMYDLSF